MNEASNTITTARKTGYDTGETEMTIHSRTQQTASPNNHQSLHITFVLFGIAVVHLAQGFFQRAGWMSCQRYGVLY